MAKPWKTPYLTVISPFIRHKIRLIVLELLLATALAYAAEPPIRYESSVDAMGSTFSIAAWGSDRGTLTAAVESALEEARRLDRMLSNYRPESEWSEVNRSAAGRGVAVSQELFDLLAACVRYSEQSEGTFDITVGPLMRVWGFYKGSGRMPHRSEVRSALARTGYKNLSLQTTTRTVRFEKVRPGDRSRRDRQGVCGGPDGVDSAGGGCLRRVDQRGRQFDVWFGDAAG